MNTLRTQILALALGLAVALPTFAQPYPYQNKNLPPEQRAADLLGRLTLEEKASLTMHASPAIPRLGIKPYNWWSESAQNMVPVHGEYELLYGSSSDDSDLKKLNYKF